MLASEVGMFKNPMVGRGGLTRMLARANAPDLFPGAMLRLLMLVVGPPATQCDRCPSYSFRYAKREVRRVTMCKHFDHAHPRGLETTIVRASCPTALVRRFDGMDMPVTQHCPIYCASGGAYLTATVVFRLADRPRCLCARRMGP